MKKFEEAQINFGESKHLKINQRIKRISYNRKFSKNFNGLK